MQPDKYESSKKPSSLIADQGQSNDGKPVQGGPVELQFFVTVLKSLIIWSCCPWITVDFLYAFPACFREAHSFMLTGVSPA
jgi:hypothetical protein